MGVTVDFKLIGAPQLERVFKRLPDAAQKKVIRSALRKAAKPVKARAESLIPRGPSKQAAHLADVGLKIKSLKRSRSRVGVQIVTPTMAELGISADSEGYYPAHVELGTRHVQAQPYMRNAMDSMRSATLSGIGRDIGKGIEREAKRLAKR